MRSRAAGNPSAATFIVANISPMGRTRATDRTTSCKLYRRLGGALWVCSCKTLNQGPQPARSNHSSMYLHGFSWIQRQSIPIAQPGLAINGRNIRDATAAPVIPTIRRPLARLSLRKRIIGTRMIDTEIDETIALRSQYRWGSGNSSDINCSIAVSTTNEISPADAAPGVPMK